MSATPSTPKRERSASIELITPEMASAMLAENINNRPLSSLTVKRYTTLLEEDRFLLTSDAIGFDWNGRLSNGQHRLTAIVRSGVAAELLVVRGLNPAAFAVLDVGKRRSPADALTILGYANTTMLAPAARYVVNFANLGRMGETMMSNTPENDEIIEIAEALPGLSRSVTFVKGWSQGMKGWAPYSLLASMHFLYGLVWPEKVDAFIQVLGSGLAPHARDAAFQLRERLVKERLSNHHLLRAQELALVIKALNAYVADRPIGNLKSAVNEAYPQPPDEVLARLKAHMGVAVFRAYSSAAARGEVSK